MPRTLGATGPTIASSHDGAWLALLDGDRLSIHDVRAQTEAAHVVLPSSAPGEIHLVAGPEPRVLVAQCDAEQTSLHALSVPSLEPIARRDFPGRWRVRAFIGPRALFVGEEPNDLPQLATLTSRAIVVESMPLRPGVGFAAAAPEERILVETRGQLEFWDPLTKVALFRLNLTLPPSPRFAAFASRGRLLWVASSEPTGRFDVFRFSDGRPQLQVELGATIVAVEGNPDSARVVVALKSAASTELELAEIDLSGRERRPIPSGGPVAAFAVVETTPPQLAIVRQPGEVPSLVTIGVRARTSSAGASASPTAPAAPSVPGFVQPPRPTTSAAPRPSSAAGHSGFVEERPPDPARDERPTPGVVGPDRVVDRLNAWRARLRGTNGSTALGGAEAEMEQGSQGGAAVETKEPARRAFNAAAARADTPPESDASSDAAGEDEAPTSARATRAGAERSTFAQRLAASRALDRTRGGSATDSESPRRARDEAEARPTRGLSTPIPPQGPDDAEDPSSDTEGGEERAPSVTSRPSTAARFSALRARDKAEPRPTVEKTPSAARRSPTAERHAGPSWRSTLCAWTTERLERPDAESGEAPDADVPALGLLRSRFELDEVARRALGILYGSWLIDGARGIPAARLAPAIADDADWSESLGRGALGRAGLVERRGGRTRLRPVVARLLDGHAPRTTILRSDGGGAPIALSGTSRLQLASGETPEELAATLSRDLGCDFAIVDLRHASDSSFARRASGAVIEARIFGAVPLVAVGAAAATSATTWLPLLDGGPALVAISGACPPALEHLSPWEREGDAG